MELELPVLHSDDSVAVLIDRLKDGFRYPPDESFGDEYCRIRAVLRSHPMLRTLLPDFLVSSKTVAEYCTFMGHRYQKQFEWDA
jgi:hypothetical protein